MSKLHDHVRNLREDFSKMQLDESMVKNDPFEQFEVWYDEAVTAQVNVPNGFHLSTVSAEGRPSGRILLLRNFLNGGFSFYTNYNSRKGKEIEKNPFASMTFFWPELERQVRIEGKLRKQTAEDSDEYFMSRPRESRIGAWASQQSAVLPDRKTLENAYEAAKNKFRDVEVVRPDWWGGYILVPDFVEFWQGRPSRLHDRISYRKEGDNWKIERLSP
jgi:pyridoxamine 5'-phosphate oxidase